MEHLAHLIDEFGYLAVLLGTFLEGETILVLAGFVAHQGYLQIEWVILAAFAGSLSGDQLWFALSRRHGRRWVSQRPKLAARLDLATRWLDRYPTLFVLGFRFLYGVRAVAPWAIGLSNIPARRFIILNIIAAAIWAVTFGCIGYLFGQALEAFLGDLEKLEHRLFAAVLLGIGFILAARWIARRLRPQAGVSTDGDVDQDG